MTDVRLLVVGQKMPAWVGSACAEYLPRFRHQFKLKIEEISASKKEGYEAQVEHKKRVLDKVKSNEYLVLLDERGTAYSTTELANQITQWELTGKSMVFAIGGADGWCDEMRQRADSLWSLSRLVFPHPLARVIVVEQLYRADSVRQGHPYHRS
jgi:23S rRNA (pseudouridine1915-N3)-methyltransferase